MKIHQHKMVLVIFLVLILLLTLGGSVLARDNEQQATFASPINPMGSLRHRERVS